MIKLNPARLAAAQKPKEFLNLTEAAVLMGCSPQTLRRHAKSGAVPCLKIGRFVRFSRAALEALTMGETFGGGATVQGENERDLDQ